LLIEGFKKLVDISILPQRLKDVDNLIFAIYCLGGTLKVEFLNRHLADLYTLGRNKKYPLERRVVEKFVRTVAVLEAAIDIYDLWKTASLKFEKLSGNNKYSVRLDVKYRLEMEMNWENEEKTVGIIGLTDISNHYGG